MDPLELVKLVQEEQTQAEEGRRAWQACYDAALRLVGGSITAHQLTIWCREQRDDRERYGFYKAADVYRQMISFLAVK